MQVYYRECAGAARLAKRALKRYFKRVTSHDAQRFADDVKRIRFFSVNGTEWVYKGKLKKHTSVKLVLERDGREPSPPPRELARARSLGASCS